jgi:hypothetical protein
MMLRLPAERPIVRTVYEKARSLHAINPRSVCANGTHSTQLAQALA